MQPTEPTVILVAAGDLDIATHVEDGLIPVVTVTDRDSGTVIQIVGSVPSFRQLADRLHDAAGELDAKAPF